MPRAAATYAQQLGGALLALLALAAAFAFYVGQERQIDAANQQRLRSLQLVQQLRQSSDDLTRLARTAVLTGEPRYREAFEAITEIRDGRRPWPEGYEGVYWDLVLAGRREPGTPGSSTPLLERMRVAGFSDSEFALLSQAKAASDALLQTEREAMALAAEIGPDGDAAQRLLLAQRLHDVAYHADKASIMGPIAAVQQAVEQRTAAEVASAVRRTDAARALFLLLALLLGVLLLLARRRLHRLLGGSAASLHERIRQIGRGELDAPPPAGPVLPDSVLGHLLQMQQQLRGLQTEQRSVQQRLQLAAGVFTHAREGIMITDEQGLIVEVNEAFCRVTGYPREELLGRSPRLLDSGRHEPAYYDRLWAELQQSGHWQGEVWDRRKNGELFASLETISAVRDAEGRISHYITLMTDITALKEQAQRLEHIAHYDALTALPNRVLLGDRLKHAMSMAHRHGRRIAVVYLDLDGFKAVNDEQGHEAGDRLLVELAARLRLVLREGDTLARLGGDEFVAVLLDLGDEAACQALLARMLREIAQPFQLDGKTLQVSGSMGVSYYPQREAVDADQLLRQADQAMYQAKLAGKNRAQVFDAEQAAQLRGHHESVQSIREALQRGEFVLRYQPKIRLRNAELVGVEALIRWQHPERGLLPPAAFLPLIEDHPLGNELGDWVIATGLQQLAAWRAQGLHLELSINVSARHLQQPDFVARLLLALQRHPHLQPQDLVLEVLETSALEDLVGVSRTMAEGVARGLAFSLDDFGTGYSSLTYLKRLPVAQLKIDQSFVRDMLDDADDFAILDGVIGLASAFRREVVAEGVESLEHGAVLLQLGCEQAQGFGIARPMPGEQLLDWLRHWQPPAAWQGLRALPRERLPLLRASLDHRARLRALRRWLEGERHAPPSLAPQDGLLAACLNESPRLARLRERHANLLRLGQRQLQAGRRGADWTEAERRQLGDAEAEFERLLREALRDGL
jgi:diguanylate cyclase (GGDEF)-like protein/PAS domain S-box-containing protein